MSSLDLSKVWPEWKVVGEPLGYGSYGVVYKAVRRDHGVESSAAIKVITIPQNKSVIDSLRSEGMSIDATRTHLAEVVSDFVNEIQLMETFKGVQNIVSIEDYKVVERQGEIGWDIYIRMELLTSLNSHISDKRLSEKEVIKLGVDICTALEVCTKSNVIHRDIKPQNIFIHKFGHFKLGDFGIARTLENVTGGLSQKGSPNYMAPEVAHSRQYDATVDLYSLGIVLYQLMNKNRLPFLDTERQLLTPHEREDALNRRLAGEPLPAPCDASPAMAEVILCAANPDPSKRFTSAEAMKNALNGVANGTYTAREADLNKTNSVRHATQTQDPNRTTSVREVPHRQESAQKSVDTFGGNEKPKIPAIIAAVFVVVLLVGSGVFAVPRLLGHNDGQESSANAAVEADNSSDSTDDGKNSVYSDFDEEQISAAIEEAEALAADGDYEGALTKIKTALITYPKSEALQAKETEYTEALAAQVKEKTLEEAEKLAESGDYVSAIALIKNAQGANGEDADYTNAYNTYCASYKAEVITAADELSGRGDYLGAIQKIAEATAVIGEDAELTTKSQGYEDAYISEVIEQADELANAENYDEALALIKNAQKTFPRNEALQAKLNEINAQKPHYLVDILQPYESNDYEMFGNGASVMMGGMKRFNGFTLDVYGWNGQSCAIYNLNGQYTRLSGIIGYVDGKTGDGQTWDVNIFGDDKLLFTCVAKPGDLPQEFSIDITDVVKLEFRTGSTNGFSGYIGFAELQIKGAGNANTQSLSAEQDDENAVNLVDKLQPYESNDYEMFGNGTSVMMGGMKRYNGFTLNVYGWNGQSCAIYNLNKQYTKLTGITSYVDGRTGDGQTWDVNIFGDDKLLFTCVVKPGDLPQEFSVDVTDVVKLEFRTGSTNGFSGYIGFAELKLYN